MAKGVIHINKISIENADGRTRLIFDITENGQPKQTFFETEKKYGEYLCHERCDAIVIGLLSYAMRLGLDIKSEVPITEELLYNLNEYLIPALTKYDAKLTAIKIDAPVATSIPNVGAVGTGLSCGVDSFHTILSHTNTPYKNRNLTHLVINNVGAFAKCYNDPENVKKDCYERARKVAKELRLPLIETNSDFQTAFPQNHLQTHTYSSIFAVYCMQKLWSTFYYSSGNELEYFSLKNSSDAGTGHYDIFSLNCFSTDELRIYSGGAALDRLQKVEQIADNKTVQANLHVCTSKSYNCGKCEKCKRTLLELYALGKLGKFGKAFDIEYFRENESEYFRWLCNMHSSGDEINEPTYQSLIQHDNALRREIWAYEQDLRREEKRGRRKKIIEAIFSVKNENTSSTTRKVVTVLGQKIKLKPRQNTHS